MKVKYLIKNSVEYDCNKLFTFGTEYKVIADYSQRQSGQQIQDNGFVVIDNRGCENMLFSHEVEIIEDGEECYTFSYNKQCRSSSIPRNREEKLYEIKEDCDG